MARPWGWRRRRRATTAGRGGDVRVLKPPVIVGSPATPAQGEAGIVPLLAAMAAGSWWRRSRRAVRRDVPVAPQEHRREPEREEVQRLAEPVREAGNQRDHQLQSDAEPHEPHRRSESLASGASERPVSGTVKIARIEATTMIMTTHAPGRHRLADVEPFDQLGSGTGRQMR